MDYALSLEVLLRYMLSLMQTELAVHQHEEVPQVFVSFWEQIAFLGVRKSNPLLLDQAPKQNIELWPPQPLKSLG